MASEIPSKRILDAVAAAYGVPQSDIIGPRRTRDIARARHVAAYLLHRVACRSLAFCGHVLGNRDHTTIVFSVQVIERLLPTDAVLRDQVERLTAAVQEAGEVIRATPPANGAVTVARPTNRRPSGWERRRFAPVLAHVAAARAVEQPADLAPTPAAPIVPTYETKPRSPFRSYLEAELINPMRIQASDVPNEVALELERTPLPREPRRALLADAGEDE